MINLWLAKTHPGHGSSVRGLSPDVAVMESANGQVLEDQVRMDPPERSEGLEQDAQQEVQGSHREAYRPGSGAHFEQRSRSALPASSAVHTRKLQ